MEACFLGSAFTSCSASALLRLVASLGEIVPKAISTAINNSIVPCFLIGDSEELYASRRTFVWSFIDTLVFYRQTTQ